ncbi:MAG: hypothetical protein ACI31S_05400 [Bacilli bacterium]
MKKMLRPCLVILLVLFSFFYTDKIMNLINKKDPLMTTISEKSIEYKLEAVDATITDNKIIPGIKGREVDLDKSYEEMKLGGVFREDAIIFKYIYPSSSIDNNKDKYIIKGNSRKNEVAILYIVNSSNDIEKVSKLNNISLFVSSNYLTTSNINDLKDKEIYTYGKNGIYTSEILTSDSAIINRISNNRSVYCLTKEEDNEVLNVCNSSDMFVIIPSIIGDYLEVKNDLSSGSIILLNNLNNFDLIVRYINSKGYNIVSLSTLLEE